MKKIIVLLAFIGILITSGCQTVPITPTNPYISDIKSSSASGFVQEGDEFQIFFTIENPTKIDYRPYIVVKFDDDLLDRQPYFSQTQRTELEVVNPNSPRNYHINFRAVSDISRIQNPQTPVTIYLMGDQTSDKPIDSKSVLVKVSE